MANPVTAILWDIDGTLLGSGGRVAATFLDAVETVCGVRPDPDALDFGGRLDPDIAAMLVSAVGGAPGIAAEALVLFESLVAERRDALHPHVAVLPGVRDLLRALHDVGAVQTVVTGNLESVGHFKLDAAGLVPPIELSLGGFGASGADRAAVAAFAFERLRSSGWGGSAEDCWVVGDTPRDVACARAIGVRCALVATGRHSVESLTGLGADVVLPGLADRTLLPPSWFT